MGEILLPPFLYKHGHTYESGNCPWLAHARNRRNRMEIRWRWIKGKIMAGRRFRSQFRLSWEAKSCDLFAKISIGAAGAPTLTWGTGIKSVTRNSAGNYSIALQDNYAALIDAEAKFIVSGAAPAAPVVVVDTDSSSSASAPLVKIVCYSGATATDPASGEKILLKLCLRDSSIF